MGLKKVELEYLMHLHHAMMIVMRTTINVNSSVLKNAKAAAMGRGVTLGELLEDALRSYLSQRDQLEPPPFRLHTVRGQLVQPNLDLDRTSALLISDDESAYPRPPHVDA
jgi:hypothetical protein